jgi:hypothetical protein
LRFAFAGSKEAGTDKGAAAAQKAPVVQRGRFSVTSDNVNLEVNFFNLEPGIRRFDGLMFRLMES